MHNARRPSCLDSIVGQSLERIFHGNFAFESEVRVLGVGWWWPNVHGPVMCSSGRGSAIVRDNSAKS